MPLWLPQGGVERGVDGWLARCARGKIGASWVAGCVHKLSSPPPLPRRPSQRVFLEFFDQGDRQKLLGHDVLSFMDREQADIPKAQQGFLKFICEPTFRTLAIALPGVNLAVDNLSASLSMLTLLEGKPTADLLTKDLSQLLPDRPARYGAIAPRPALPSEGSKLSAPTVTTAFSSAAATATGSGASAPAPAPSEERKGEEPPIAPRQSKLQRLSSWSTPCMSSGTADAEAAGKLEQDEGLTA